jgi:carbamoyltransferase
VSVSLGIHVGHNSACAVVVDGELVAAVTQERLTRVKHDGEFALTNRLPIRACLDAVGLSLANVDLIVSSFQAASPGGIGLDRPVIEPSFDVFDPFDNRHRVISHHLAHAHHAWGGSGFTETAVLVVDLGGATTVDGHDFSYGFDVWLRSLDMIASTHSVKTENLSIYEAGAGGVRLIEREYCVPHSAPETFVNGVASLYDNVSRAVFQKDHAHGQLMALAAMGANLDPTPLSESDLVQVDDSGCVMFRNDWQQLAVVTGEAESAAWLARLAQRATEHALGAYCRRVRRCTRSSHLAVAGGAFLNILANTSIAGSGLFERYYVPSAPHDAGIAPGCAFWGHTELQGPRRGERSWARDRLGPVYSADRVESALASSADFVAWAAVNAPDVAAHLSHGELIARWFGRSEFGPRALGARSILGSPLLESTRLRMNEVKGRQPWRPVAPIVLTSALSRYFCGPSPSPYMTFAHFVREEHRDSLVALRHADGSTRAQTLDPDDDPKLSAILEAFDRRTGVPILVNTSMNGAGEPMVETPEQALDFLLDHDGVDALILEDHLVHRRPVWSCWEDVHDSRVALARGVIMTMYRDGDGHRRVIAAKGRRAIVLEEPLVGALTTRTSSWPLERLRKRLAISDPSGASDRLLYKLFALGLLVRVQT